MTLNVEAYEYTPLAQHGVGLRLFVDEMVYPRRQVNLVPGSHGGVLLAPGTRTELTLQRRDVIDDVGNNAVYLYPTALNVNRIQCVLSRDYNCDSTTIRRFTIRGGV